LFTTLRLVVGKLSERGFVFDQPPGEEVGVSHVLQDTARSAREALTELPRSRPLTILAAHQGFTHSCITISIPLQANDARPGDSRLSETT
jgi:hypothetical protein